MAQYELTARRRATVGSGHFSLPGHHDPAMTVA